MVAGMSPVHKLSKGRRQSSFLELKDGKDQKRSGSEEWETESSEGPHERYLFLFLSLPPVPSPLSLASGVSPFFSLCRASARPLSFLCNLSLALVFFSPALSLNRSFLSRARGLFLLSLSRFLATPHACKFPPNVRALCFRYAISYYVSLSLSLSLLLYLLFLFAIE